MLRIWMLGSALALSSCAESTEDQLRTTRSGLEEVEQRLKDAEHVCNYGPPRTSREIREEAIAEWDIAAAENLDNISQQEEWRIRKAIGAEIGLPASDVNGWKDIYRSRAEQATRRLQERKATESRREKSRLNDQKEACASLPEYQRDVDLLRANASKLEIELGESKNEIGIIGWLGYAMLTIIILGVYPLAIRN